MNRMGLDEMSSCPVHSPVHGPVHSPAFTLTRRFVRSTNRSHAPALSITQGHQCPGSKNWKTPLSTSPHHSLYPSKLRRVWLEGSPIFNNAMLWAASTTTFFHFCRSGKVTVQCESKFDPQTYLCFSDIAVDNALSPNTISIKLKHSKMDQFKKEVKLVMGRTNDDLCPVTALLPYLIHPGDAPGPLFQWDNHTLSKSKFVNHIHPALLAANVPAHLYTGHSFHI